MSLYKVTIKDKDNDKLILSMEVWLTNLTNVWELRLVLSNTVISYLYWKKYDNSIYLNDAVETTMEHYWVFLEHVKDNIIEANHWLEIFNQIFVMDIKEIELPNTVEELLK